ncbi:LemA family protein [Coraliomargarita sp. SDUM461004]|uniref:LemA family protein n=1 Tax=Thalassobacterium sedimentorum TaxID=3041258 RepID=A0ABU1AMB3_9BACT|nr:LemA family protein [Coraliomargarita sp. SDUM461004]MDQ8195847.1 LemA family protein [Coraliomargarita sp. SDUM461004]|tara:strand:- start:6671 stop:7267 length:597 start_codon:yes stop_codon:yes gene_type:complete
MMKQQRNGCLFGSLIALGVVLLMVLIGYFYIKGIYNRIVTQDEAVDANWAQVENVLQRRFDLIPNLVNTVKGFAKQEREVLTEVTALRSQWAQAGSVSEKAQAATGLEAALGKLMVISERYPDLKSNQNFLRLQDELAGTENRVSVERRRYNESVQAYNTTIRTFPAVLIANNMGFEKKEAYFEAVSEAASAPVVDFE